MMGNRNDRSGARARRAAARGVVAVAVVALSAACHDKKEPTGPDEKPRGDGISASIAVAALPPWMPAWVAALPADARPVWNACRNAGTMNQSGTPFLVGTNCRMMRIDGYPRRYVVYVPNHPDVVAGNDVPLVVMYHGSGQSGERFHTQSAWREEADARGFIVAFPSGLQYQLLTGGITTKWNSYGLLADINPAWQPTGYPGGAPWPADDSTFTHRLLDDLIAQSNIDTMRVHASGFSNGGSMVSRLAIELSDRFASVASITSPYPKEYTPLERIPYFSGTGALDVHAIADINAHLQVGQPAVASVPLDTATFFGYTSLAQRRDSMSATFDLDPDPTSVTTNGTWTLMKWRTPLPGNNSGNEAWWGIIRGVEHEYPRGPGRNFPSNNPLGFDAPRTFWSFFRTHPK